MSDQSPFLSFLLLQPHFSSLTHSPLVNHRRATTNAGTRVSAHTVIKTANWPIGASVQVFSGGNKKKHDERGETFARSLLKEVESWYQVVNVWKAHIVRLRPELYTSGSELCCSLRRTSPKKVITHHRQCRSRQSWLVGLLNWHFRIPGIWTWSRLRDGRQKKLQNADLQKLTLVSFPRSSNVEDDCHSLIYVHRQADVGKKSQ